MSFCDTLEEILQLQDYWSSKNTDEMLQRGNLIRKEGPAFLRTLKPRLAAALGPGGADLIIEGRDGTGRKTEIPWIRFGSKSRSPGAQDGWYCVFLFHARGEGVYLSLMHGSTQFINGEYVPRSDQELRRHVMWARQLLANDLEAGYETVLDIDLGTSRKLGLAYQKSSATALWHGRGQIPEDDELTEEIASFAALLRKIYDAGDLGRAPGATAPEVTACETARASIARPATDTASRKGQGFGLSAAERSIVERHAMERAEKLLRSEGYNVRDVSRTHPFDFIAHNEAEELIVEVKGTTSELGTIILTANEVDTHRKRFPQNMLIVVHTIELDRSSAKPVASGGYVEVIRPWRPLENDLKPLSFRYNIVDRQS